MFIQNSTITDAQKKELELIYNNCVLWNCLRNVKEWWSADDLRDYARDRFSLEFLHSKEHGPYFKAIQPYEPSPEFESQFVPLSLTNYLCFIGWACGGGKVKLATGANSGFMKMIREKNPRLAEDLMA